MSVAPPAAIHPRGRLRRVSGRFPRPRTWPQLLLVAAMAGYSCAFSWWTVRNHDGFGTFGFDVGIFDQGVWLLSRFHDPFVTINGRNLFGDHTSFILLPFAPIYWLLPSAKVLLVAQSVALALSALPVFFIARRRLDDEWLALALGVTVLLQPALQWTNVDQFHPEAFEPVLVGLMLLFMFDRRWTPYFLSIAALLSVKEDTPLLVIAVGVYVFVRYDRKVGLVTCGAAAAYAVVAVYGVMRALNGVGSVYLSRLPFGGLGGLLRTTFTDPGQLGSYLRSDERPNYLWQLFAPFAFLSLLAPDVAVLASGPIALNLVSNFYYQHAIHYHYSTLVTPILAVATVVGIARLRGVFLRSLAVGTATAIALLTAYYWGPTPWAAHPAPLADPRNPALTDVRRALATIPADASVSAFYGYVSHLDHRREIYNFPVPWRAEYWGTFDREGQRLPQADRVEYVAVPAHLAPDQQAVLDAIRPDFTTVFESPYVLVLRRK